jgi:hypothetical protein
MQGTISTDVLVPLGAGAVGLIIALFVVVVRAVGKPSPDTAAQREVTHADWTGEAANGRVDLFVPLSSAASSSAASSSVEQSAPPSPAEQSPVEQAPVEAPSEEPTVVPEPRRLTVAEAVAVREASTSPLPFRPLASVASVASVGASGGVETIALPGPEHIESRVDTEPAVRPAPQPRWSVDAPAEPDGSTEIGSNALAGSDAPAGPDAPVELDAPAEPDVSPSPIFSGETAPADPADIDAGTGAKAATSPSPTRIVAPPIVGAAAATLQPITSRPWENAHAVERTAVGDEPGTERAEFARIEPVAERIEPATERTEPASERIEPERTGPAAERTWSTIIQPVIERAEPAAGTGTVGSEPPRTDVPAARTEVAAERAEPVPDDVADALAPTDERPTPTMLTGLIRSHAEPERSRGAGSPGSAESAESPESAGSFDNAESAGSPESTAGFARAEHLGNTAEAPAGTGPSTDTAAHFAAAREGAAEPPQGEAVPGSTRAVAEALQHALAVRAAAAERGAVRATHSSSPDEAVAPTGDEPGSDAPAEVVPEPRTPDSTTDESRNAVRDRLLAVLLTDPDRAVGATVDLDSSQGTLQRLSEAVRQEQASLGAVLRRLLDSGLSVEQVAKLAGRPTCDVATILGRTLDRSTDASSVDSRSADAARGPRPSDAEPGARHAR